MTTTYKRRRKIVFMALAIDRRILMDG